MSALSGIAAQMMAAGKGVLAADESVGTGSGRLEKVGVESTADNRAACRAMLVSTPPSRGRVPRTRPSRRDWTGRVSGWMSTSSGARASPSGVR